MKAPSRSRPPRKNRKAPAAVDLEEDDADGYAAQAQIDGIVVDVLKGRSL
jgi:hypothetical protein